MSIIYCTERRLKIGLEIIDIFNPPPLETCINMENWLIFNSKPWWSGEDVRVIKFLRFMYFENKIKKLLNPFFELKIRGL